MVPSFPQKRALPWALLAVSLFLVAIGFLTDDRSVLLLGAAGVAATIIGYPLARFVLGPEPKDEVANDEPPAHP